MPKTAAVMISRSNPSTRETTVAVTTTLMFFRCFDKRLRPGFRAAVLGLGGPLPAVALAKDGYCTASFNVPPSIVIALTLVSAMRSSSGSFCFEAIAETSRPDTPGIRCNGQEPR